MIQVPWCFYGLLYSVFNVLVDSLSQWKPAQSCCPPARMEKLLDRDPRRTGLATPGLSDGAQASKVTKVRADFCFVSTCMFSKATCPPLEPGRALARTSLTLMITVITSAKPAQSPTCVTVFLCTLSFRERIGRQKQTPVLKSCLQTVYMCTPARSRQMRRQREGGPASLEQGTHTFRKHVLLQICTAAGCLAI